MFDNRTYKFDRFSLFSFGSPGKALDHHSFKEGISNSYKSIGLNDRKIYEQRYINTLWQHEFDCDLHARHVGVTKINNDKEHFVGQYEPIALFHKSPRQPLLLRNHPYSKLP